jgi:predicted Zn-dependent peptidase
MVCLLVLTQISLSAQSYKLPDYTTFKLPNGIFLMEQHDVPVISVSALIPAGAINDKDKSDLLH